MKHKFFILLVFILSFITKNNFAIDISNNYFFLQDVNFELYDSSKDISFKIPEHKTTIEDILMYEIIHAHFINKKWVAYTSNEKLTGKFKVGYPAYYENKDIKKLFFVADFSGSKGGLDLYYSEFIKGEWQKPINLGATVNGKYNESNPGVLDENTLTYSSNGIIKKINLQTLVVEEDKNQTFANTTTTTTNTPIKEEKSKIIEKIKEEPKIITKETIKEVVVTKPNKTITKIEEENQNTITEKEEIVEQKINTPKVETIIADTKKIIPFTYSKQELGVIPRANVLAMYPISIQLGAYLTPNWELLKSFSSLGNLVTFKNDKNLNIVWLTGFNDRIEAEQVLPQIHSKQYFDKAYIVTK